ncbi:MAG TPA: HAD family hydrolase [Frankiaceae bacterium]
MPADALTLVFDADDTLWENNVLFNRAIADYIAWLAHPTLDGTAIRGLLLDIERANAAAHGYGSQVFLRSLHDCFEHLNARPVTAAEQQEIHAFARALVEHRIELVPQVSETLAELAGRHTLRLLTKGDPAEQQAKIDASGLAPHFASTSIVREKDEATYRELTVELGLDPGTTWMIGNSPKSDIAPARAAGWRAVFLPNEHTWELELTDLAPDPGVLELRSFAELRRHF